MHIMEGFLPPMWAIAWWLIFLPFLGAGIVRLKAIVQEDANQKVLLALCGAFIFVLSALKIPSVTGSCSHPTGVALAVILFGPSVVAVLGSIVLLFQALLLAHGGLTTLGANGMFTMGGAVKAAECIQIPTAADPFLGIEYTKLEQGIRDIFGKKGPEVVGMNILALEAGYDVAKKLL